MELKKAFETVEKAIKNKENLIVVGKCSVKYQGRAASKLAEGERIVFIKEDGSFLVHQNKNLAAINYQPPKGRLSTEIQDGVIIIKAQRRKPKELLEAVFSNVFLVNSFLLKDDNSIKVFGTEKNLSNLLMQDLEVIEKGLDKKTKAREKAFKIQRAIIPKCAKAIRDVQKNNIKKAKKDLKEIEKTIKKVEKELKDYPELISPMLGSCYQEYAELCIFLGYVENGKLVKVNVPPEYYLTGLGDAIGELKRIGMELLAEGNVKGATKLHSDLEEIYGEFSNFIYPNAIVPGLKHKQDVARKILNDFYNHILLVKMKK